MTPEEYDSLIQESFDQAFENQFDATGEYDWLSDDYDDLEYEER